MSVLKKFTNEQIAAFQECKTQEELIAKANELGIEYSEEDLKEAVELLGTIETIPAGNGELDDDALDAVAGGCTYKDGYAVVTMNVKCFAPGKPYAQDPYPTHPGTLKGDRCGTFIHCQTRQGMEICTLVRSPEITNK